ncbi:MAG: VWA domain-containing protein [Burkholderiaceae bacterium]
MMSFAHPDRLLWLGAVLLVLLVALVGLWRQRQLLHAQGGANPFRPTLREGLVRSGVGALLSITALSLLVLALAMPHWGQQTQSFKRQGRDFLILLDVSLSMRAQDTAPNRLGSAIKQVEEMVELVREEGGHRLGLIAFAGRASPLVPMTSDYALFLNRLSTVERTTIRRGSQIGDALRHALYGYGALAHPFTDLIVISDGEDHGSGPAEVAQVAARLGVTIHAIGVGDSREGARIPVAEGDGSRFVSLNGTEIITRMRPATLVEISRITGGEFVSAGTDSAALSGLYKKRLAAEPRRQLSVKTSDEPVQRFQWFVGAAMALLVLEMLISVYRRRESATLPAGIAQRVASMLGLVVAAALMFATPHSVAETANVEDLIEQGNQKYQTGDFHAAADHYAAALALAPESPTALFNLATARFKLYDYSAAIEHYSLALPMADAEMRQAIQYNLGVVKHQQAIGNMLTFQDALAPLQTAADYYRDSLEKAPSFEDARYNLELAHLLEQEIRQQKVLAQANAKLREQKTSDNKGQAANEPGDKPTDEAPDEQAEQKESSNENPSGGVPMQQSRQSTQAKSSLDQQGKETDMDMEEAMREIELARGRAESSAEQRHQRRRARMQADSVSKFW